jgi:hypothetical protein
MASAGLALAELVLDRPSGERVRAAFDELARAV